MKERFVCVTAETGVLRNRKDAEGRFMRETLGDDFFPTSSGYKACFTAGGVNLKHGDPEKALEIFVQLPENERNPGAVKVGTLDSPDISVAPAPPPEEGMILKVFARLMKRAGDGSLEYVGIADFPLMADRDEADVGRIGYLFEASADHVWITGEEWKALVPEQPKPQQQIELPDAVALRICRFHLVPQRIYGEGGEWSRQQVRSAKLVATVEEATGDTIRYKISGHARLGSEYDAASATTPNGPLDRGYESTFAGFATYDRRQQRFTRFDMVSDGDTWGRMGDANGRSVSVERPGRNPLMFAFELVSGESPADRLVPMGRASKLAGHQYFETGP